MKCSEGNPCERCLRLTGKNHASRCLIWMECFRPSFQELNKFGNGNELCRTSEISTALEYLSQVNVHMGVRTALPWTIDILTTTVASELFLASPGTNSQCGWCVSSSGVKEEASTLMDPTLFQLTRSFVYVATFLHTFSHVLDSGIPRSGLRALLAYMLFEITQLLDRNLKPRQLAVYSERQLKCLCLVLIGLSMAATYPTILSGDNETSASGEAEEQLVKLLDHFIVYISEQTCLLPEHAATEPLCTACESRLEDIEPLFAGISPTSTTRGSTYRFNVH